MSEESKELQPAGATTFMGAMSIQQARERYKALKEFTKELMAKDRDYGVIPGTGERKVLLKPGAEKLCWFFGLRSEFTAVEAVQDWEQGFFSYRYKCRLHDRSGCVAEGEGSCNSKEKKYRYRTAYEDTITLEERQHVVREETRRGRNGRTYKAFQILNDDPYSLVNTFVKMAQKRALIAATLIAANASDYFNNDDHDEDAIDVEATPARESGEGRSRGGERDAAGVERVIVRIKSVGEKSTTGNGGARNTLFNVEASDGARYSTFDTRDGELLKGMAGKMVELGFSINGKGYRNIAKGDIRPVDESEVQDGQPAAGLAVDMIRITCKSPAPAEWRRDLAAAGFTCSGDGLTWSAVETEASSNAAMQAEREPWCKECTPIAAG